MRSTLEHRVAYRHITAAAGLKWYEYSMFFTDTISHPAIHRIRIRRHAQSFRAGPRRKGRSSSHAPIIKLASRSHRRRLPRLLGLLNSSTACFWMRQVCSQQGWQWNRAWHKGRDTGNSSTTLPATDCKRLPFPIPSKPLHISRQLDRIGSADYATCLPDDCCNDSYSPTSDAAWLEARSCDRFGAR